MTNATTASATTINNNELKKELADVYDGFIAELNLVDDSLINIRAHENAWTPGQITDHIIRSTGQVPDEQVEPAKRPINQHVAQLAAIFLNFETKMQSPDFVLPGDGPFEKKKLIDDLAEIKHGHLALIDSKDLSQLCTTFEFPFIGFLTRLEWIKFITFHTQRHLRQLKNCRDEITHK